MDRYCACGSKLFVMSVFSQDFIGKETLHQIEWMTCCRNQHCPGSKKYIRLGIETLSPEEFQARHQIRKKIETLGQLVCPF